MKRLISEEEMKISNPSEWCKVSDKFFISADFAEEKLKYLAIEFAEWHLQLYDFDYDSFIELNTTQIFEKFLSTRE